MKTSLDTLHEIYDKVEGLLIHYNNLPERDIRRVYFEILRTQIAVCERSLRINMDYANKNKKDFEALLTTEKQREDYVHHFLQNTAEAIFDTALFQTELLFRVLYSKLTGQHVGQEKNLHKVIAVLCEDTENNWKKEESRLLLLIQSVRNTIHTGGIYFHDPNGTTLTYKAVEYKFEYGKGPAFIKEGFSFFLISELVDIIHMIFQTQKIINLGSWEHPNFAALGK
jgi:hypothetical protein